MVSKSGLKEDKKATPPPRKQQAQYEVEIASAHNLLINNQRGAAILIQVRRTDGAVIGTLGIGPATLTWRAFNSSKDVTLTWEKVSGLFSALQ